MTFVISLMIIDNDNISIKISYFAWFSLIPSLYGSCLVRFTMRDETCALKCIRYEYTVQSTEYTVHSWSILVLCCGAQTSSRWSSVRARRCATCSPSRTRTSSASSARAMQSPRQRPASISRGLVPVFIHFGKHTSSSTLRCASALDVCASSASYTSLFSLAIYLAHLKTLLCHL